MFNDNVTIPPELLVNAHYEATNNIEVLAD